MRHLQCKALSFFSASPFPKYFTKVLYIYFYFSRFDRKGQGLGNSTLYISQGMGKINKHSMALENENKQYNSTSATVQDKQYTQEIETSKFVPTNST